MSLPKLKSPYFPVNLVGAKTKARIRPFTVAEEKLLLMAMQDKDDTDFILRSIYEALDSCIEGDDIKANKLAIFDIEYLFIQLRARSVGNMTTLRFKDGEETIEVEIDLDKVIVSVDENHTNKITLDDTYVMTMKYPTFEDVLAGENNKDKPMTVISRVLDKVVNSETGEVLDVKTYSEKEISEFIDSFSMSNLKDIQEFFNTMPSVKIKVEYITKDGEKKDKEIVGLISFFTL